MKKRFYIPKGCRVEKKEVYFVYHEDGRLLGEFYDPVEVKEEIAPMPRLEHGMFGRTNDGDCFVVVLLESKRFLVYQDGSFDNAEELEYKDVFPRVDYLFKGIKSFDQVDHFIRMLEGGRRDVVGDRLVWTKFRSWKMSRI